MAETLKRAEAEISYPEMGHRLCAEIEDTSYWFAHRNRAIAAFVKRYPPLGPIIDIGGGNGVVSQALNEAGFETWLIEPGPEGAANARRRGVPRVMEGRVEEAGMLEGSLGGAGLFDVLEHIDEPTHFLRHVSRLLLPAAPLFITVPAYPWLWSQDDVDAGHYRRYTPNALAGELAQAGFALQDTTYLFRFIPILLMLLKALPDRLKLPRRSASESSLRDHHLPGGMVGDMIGRSLRHEQERITSGGRVAFGSSLLAVARNEPE